MIFIARRRPTQRGDGAALLPRAPRRLLRIYYRKKTRWRNSQRPPSYICASEELDNDVAHIRDHQQFVAPTVNGKLNGSCEPLEPW